VGTTKWLIPGTFSPCSYPRVLDLLLFIFLSFFSVYFYRCAFLLRAFTTSVYSSLLDFVRFSVDGRRNTVASQATEQTSSRRGTQETGPGIPQPPELNSTTTS